MNVLIVDNDKAFVNAVSSLFYETNSSHKLFYNDNSLCEKSENYDVKLVSLDLISEKDLNSNNSNSSLIGISPDYRTTKKYLNNPNIQKVFQKPVDVVALAKYLDNYCDTRIYKRNECISILNRLVKMGFGINNKGTIYLAECINESRNRFNVRLTELAKVVGKRNNVSSDIVIWSIQNAVNRTLKIKGEEAISRCLRIYDGRKPTAKIIIDYFSNTI